MQVYKDWENLPELEGTVLTVGSFDGVHGGHQKILEQIKSIAKRDGKQSVVMTFHPHPRTVVYPNENNLRLLSSLEEKQDLLELHGIDILVVVPFTKVLSQMLPEDYLKSILVEKFNPSHIVIGYDHKFGQNRAGDINLLRSKADTYGYSVTEITKHDIDQLTVSSTQIRKAIKAGDLETANNLLKRPYELSGIVVSGKKLGKELGFPTANLKVDDELKLIPMDGIYVCYVMVNGLQYQGMLYIGDNPTLGEGNPKAIEVNIFDFDKDIYGERISIQLLSFLRGDKKFEGLAALKQQLEKDKIQSLAYFSGQTQNAASSEISIAILNYNSQKLLEKFLPSFLEIGQETELLIIDNGSNDDSVAFLEDSFPSVNVKVLDKNHGYAGGYNKGLKDVDSKYVAFVNSDVEVTMGWLEPLISYLDDHHDCGAVMPKILSYNDKSSFEYAGAAGGFLDVLGYPYCRGRIFETVEKDNGQYDDIIEVDWLSGAAFLMRLDVFKALGGFDEDFFAHQEEIDLCWRLRRAGYRLSVLPTSIIYHLGGGTLDYGNNKKVFLNFRNNLAMMVKNEEAMSLLWKLPFRLVLDGVAGLKFAMGGSLGGMWAVIKAHLAFYVGLPKLLGKRRKISKLIENVGKPKIVKHSNKSKFVLFDYYLKGKKTFSQIHDER